MQSFIKLLFLCFMPALLVAQGDMSKLESLHNYRNTASNDTIKMNANYKLGIYFSEITPDSSVAYLEKALNFAKQLKLKLNEAHILNWLGYVYSNRNNYPKALSFFLEGINLLENSATEKSFWNAPGNPAEKVSRLQSLSSIYNDIGLLYGRTGSINKQLESYTKARKIAESTNDSAVLVYCDMSLGEVYLLQGNLDTALALEKASFNIASKIDNKYGGYILWVIGRIYQAKKEFILARDNFKKAIQYSERKNTLSIAGDCNLSLAKLFTEFSSVDSALMYAKRAEAIYQTTKVPFKIAECYSVISSLYKKINNKDSSFYYLQQYVSIKDSLTTNEKKNLISFQNIGFNEQIRLQELEKEKIQTQNKTRIIAMLVGLGVLLLIGIFLYNNNRQKQKANKVLEKTLTDLKDTQSQLIQSEKMASLGELTAGIAHEIQNPLNFVNNFSEVSNEMIEEMKEEIKKGNYEEVNAIADDLKKNLEKINHHGKRADGIVKGMLQHSRSSSGTKEPININALADEYLRLAYHGLRAKDKSFNATMKTDYDSLIEKINVIPQDMGRLMLNLITNAFYAVREKQKEEGIGFAPIVTLTTKKREGKVELSVADNGNGIPEHIKEKIFQPFFTTKPTGQGTGLGLSLAYDIVKAHGGEIKVTTKEDEGTEFTISLPL